MKISVSTYSFSAYRAKTKCSYSDICRLTKELGFDGIEFTQLEPGTVEQALEIKNYCKEIGLPIVSYAVGANFARLFPSLTVKKLKKQIDIAAALGAPVMRHDVCYVLAPGKDWRKVADKMAPYIKQVTEYAKSKGVKTCTENHGFIFQEPERVKYLIDKVNDENYRWLCDIGNFLCAGAESLPSVKIAAPYAVHCHVKDFFRTDKPLSGSFRATDGKYLLGTIIGKGDVPVKECIEALKEGGYDGYISLEFEGKEDNIPAVQSGLAFLRECLK